MNPTFSTVGQYYVRYVVTLANYTDFEGGAWVQILPREELKAITAADVAVDYDGNFHGITLVDALESDVVTYWTEDANWGAINPQFKLPGQYRVNYRVVRGAGIDDTVSSAMVTIRDKVYAGVTVTGYSGVYDKQAHGALVEGDLALATVEYSVDGENWSQTNKTFTDACSATVYVRITRTRTGDLLQLSSTKIEIAPVQLAWDTSALAPTFTRDADGKNVVSVSGELQIRNVLDGDTATLHPGARTLQLSDDYGNPATLTVEFTGYSLDNANYRLPDSAVFRYTGGTLDIPFHGMTVTGWSNPYDHGAHRVSAALVTETTYVKIEYSEDGGATWSQTCSQYADVCDVPTLVRATDFTGRVLMQQAADMKITPATQTGITADDVRAMADGKTYKITVKGAAADATVSYLAPGATDYSSVNPGYIAAGTYVIGYKVVRANYSDFVKTATIAITQPVITAEGVDTDYDGNQHHITLTGTDSRDGVYYW